MLKSSRVTGRAIAMPRRCGSIANLVAQVVERSSDSRIAPARVVEGHSDDQRFDFDCHLRATRRSSVSGIARVSIRRSPLRPIALASTASRRRGGLVNRNRFPPRCSRSARLLGSHASSSRRYSRTFCRRRFTQPAKINIRN